MTGFESFVGVNPWTALFTFCNMLITFSVLKHFLFKHERDSLLRDATVRAQKREEDILNEARSEAASIRAAAEADIAQERKKAVNDLKNEIGGMAVEIAGKVVEREINEADHQALIDEFIRNVGDAS